MNPTEQLRQDFLTMLHAAVMAEREACAKIADQRSPWIARSIRARPPFKAPPMAISLFKAPPMAICPESVEGALNEIAEALRRIEAAANFIQNKPSNPEG